jgi:hypothetical protein
VVNALCFEFTGGRERRASASASRRSGLVSRRQRPGDARRREDRRCLDDAANACQRVLSREVAISPALSMQHTVKGLDRSRKIAFPSRRGRRRWQDAHQMKRRRPRAIGAHRGHHRSARESSSRTTGRSPSTHKRATTVVIPSPTTRSSSPGGQASVDSLEDPARSAGSPPGRACAHWRDWRGEGFCEGWAH